VRGGTTVHGGLELRFPSIGPRRSSAGVWGSWRRWWERLGCEGLDWEVVETSNPPEARRPSMALFEL